MANAVVQKQKFSTVINSDAYKRMINNTLNDPRKAHQFVTAITSAVAANPELQECDPATIVSGGLLGTSLELSPSPQLGHFYLVPFNNSKEGKKDAAFILGYKGYLQLAMRSGQYRTINAIAVKKGELVKFDPFTEEIVTKPIDDPLKREAAETIGYFACFEYLNGFRKAIYWSKEKMEQHATQYSKGYQAKKGYTFWEKDFDTMALKTMLKQLISHWGIMSVEIQAAFEADNLAIDQSGVNDYFTAAADENVSEEIRAVN